MPLNHTSIYSELTESHFKVIGKLVVEWANIEHLLGILVSRLLFTPELLGRSYTDEIPASRLQNALSKAIDIHRYRYNCKLFKEELLSDIEGLNNRITKIRSLRNKFAHFCWSRSSDNEIFGAGFSGKIPTKKKKGRDHLTLTVSELENAYLEAYDIVEKQTEILLELPAVKEDKNLFNSLKI